MERLLSGPLLRSIILIAAIVTSGCQDSPVGNTGDRLTTAEVDFLVNVIVQGFGAGLEISGDEFGGDIDQIFDCMAGGAFARTGTYSGEQDLDTGDRHVSVEFFQDYFNCEYTLDGAVLRLNGDPGVRHAVLVTVVDGISRFEFDLNGGMLFETFDEREGRCAIDLRIELTVDSAGDEDTVVVFDGRACGISGSELTLNVR